MKKILTILILSLGQIISFAQGKYDANWCFGVKAGIDFRDTSQPKNFLSFSNNYMATASLSDSVGNLLFYIAPNIPYNLSNINYKSHSIFNKDNIVIVDGDSLITGGSLAGAIFLEIANSKNEYYVFYFNRLDSAQLTYTNLYYGKIIKGNSNYFIEKKKSTHM